MNGRDLALGLVGALAVGAALGRRGSPNLPTRSVTLGVATPREIQRAYATWLNSDGEANPPVVWPSFDASTGLTLWDDRFGNVTEMFWTSIPHKLSEPLPFNKAEKLWEVFSVLPTYFNRLRFPLRVYRGIRVPEGYSVKMQTPGPHWTVNKQIAHRFATGEHDAADYLHDDAEGVVFEGVVERPEDVNWQRTLTDYLVYTSGHEGDLDQAEEQINSTKVTRVSARMLA
jgi:hypothetical protein